MNTPVLAAVRADLLPAHVLRDAAARADGPLAWFRVVRGGVFAGRLFEAGDVLACAGRPAVDEAVVLVPAGRGAPRLGHLRREGLWGEAGEPCHPARWTVAGRLVGVWSEVLPDLVPVPQVVFRVPPPRPAQLALFAA